jgi:threonine aldolase
MLGGGMRQAGVIAAAGIVALRTTVKRLSEDHENARRLAHGLSQLPEFSVPDSVQTNIVMFNAPPGIEGSELIRRADSRGVKMVHRGGQQIRAVTHRMVTASDIDDAVERIGLCIRR